MENKIVGLCLVRNEEFFISQVIENIRDFCDLLIIADHRSKDRTFEIARSITRQHDNIELHRIGHPKESQKFLSPYYGSPTWVFAVDGDEIYDPWRLKSLKEKLKGGELNSWWTIFGNVLHCTNIDFNTMSAEGYLSPPCRSMTKLYNFGAITDWRNVTSERLHGGQVVFKDGWNAELRHDYYKHTPWKESIFRCLHLCFFPRSRLDRTPKPGDLFSRPNIADRQRLNPLFKILMGFGQLLRFTFDSKLKAEKYRRGAIVTQKIHPFFSKAPDLPIK